MVAVAVIPPPYVITEKDKRGLIVVINATALSFVWTCLLIRTWLRWKLGEWKLDDYFLVAATVRHFPVSALQSPSLPFLLICWHQVLHSVLSGIVFNIVNDGLGRSQESFAAAALEEALKKIGNVSRPHSVPTTRAPSASPGFDLSH